MYVGALALLGYIILPTLIGHTGSCTAWVHAMFHLLNSQLIGHTESYHGSDLVLLGYMTFSIF